MADKVFGYKIILTDDQEYLWASEVSALATSFMENGFERFHNDESFCYTIRKREVFFERKHRIYHRTVAPACPVPGQYRWNADAGARAV